MNNVYDIMGIISTFFLSVPIMLILFFKMAKHSKFATLLVYFSIALFNNFLLFKYISLSKNIIDATSLVISLFNVPALLFFMIYFSKNVKATRALYLIVVVVTIFNLSVFSVVGLSDKFFIITLGPELILGLLLSCYLFLQRAKLAVLSEKANGKALMTGAMIILFGGYFILYLLYYVFQVYMEGGVLDKPMLLNVHLMYNLLIIIYTSFLSAGLIYESKRVKELFEIKQVRKELADIYLNEKDAPQKPRTPFLDFDPEWIKSNTYSH